GGSRGGTISCSRAGPLWSVSWQYVRRGPRRLNLDVPRHYVSSAGPAAERCRSASEVRVEEEIAEVVRQYGWYAASISDHQPPFLYTVCLMQTLNHPEFIMFGLEVDNAHALFSQLVQDIRAGRSYAEPGV